MEFAQRRVRFSRPGKRQIRPDHVHAAGAKRQGDKIRADVKPRGAEKPSSRARDERIGAHSQANRRGGEVHSYKLGVRKAPAEQRETASSTAPGVEDAGWPNPDVVESLEHAALYFALEYRGILAQPRCALERAPCLAQIQAERLCIHADVVTARVAFGKSERVHAELFQQGAIAGGLGVAGGE